MLTTAQRLANLNDTITALEREREALLNAPAEDDDVKPDVKRRRVRDSRKLKTRQAILMVLATTKRGYKPARLLQEIAQYKRGVTPGALYTMLHTLKKEKAVEVTPRGRYTLPAPTVSPSV